MAGVVFLMIVYEAMVAECQNEKPSSREERGRINYKYSARDILRGELGV